MDTPDAAGNPWEHVQSGAYSSGFGRWTLLVMFHNYTDRRPRGSQGRFWPGTGPDGSGRLRRFIWTDFQTKPLTLDPSGLKFDALGPDRIFGGLT